MRLISTTSTRRATTGALLLLVACTSGSNDPTTSDFMITAGPTTGSSTAAPETTTPETAATTTGEELPEIIDLYIYENPANVLSFFVEWETSAPGTGELTVECGDEYSQTFVADAEDTLHEAFVMGLLADTTCVVTLSAKMGETVDTRVVEHEVGPIPVPLPSFAVALAPTGPGGGDALAWQLRDLEPVAVFARQHDGKVLLDARTLLLEDLSTVAAAVRRTRS